MQTEAQEHFRHNFTVNVLHSSFFGLAVGFATTVTVIPLFVRTLTDSTTLIGLISSIQLIGWQLPQLFMVSRVFGLRFFKPIVLSITVHERWPFFALMIVALFISSMTTQLALALIFFLLCWQALSGGVAAAPWQSMFGKIIPEAWRGKFFGTVSSGYSLLSGLGAIIAGVILENVTYPVNFALCFFLAGLATVISWLFLAWTREPESLTVDDKVAQGEFWRGLYDILRRDRNFCWFLTARCATPFAFMALGFYTIYGVRRFDMPSETAGVMTGFLLLILTISSPLVGWLGDRLGHRLIFTLGVLAIGLSAFIAMLAPDLSWMYLAFGLAGFANAANFTTILAMTLEFGSEIERPLYVGLSNTLTAPILLAAPLIGGFLVDAFNFEIMFLTAFTAAIIAVLLLQFAVKDPRRLRAALPSVGAGN